MPVSPHAYLPSIPHTHLERCTKGLICDTLEA